jgi:hypothetical protein
MDRKELIARLNREGGEFPTADELLSYAKHNASEGYRGRYNLACYYSELAGRRGAQTSEIAEYFEEAAEMLEEVPGVSEQAGEIFHVAAEMFEEAAAAVEEASEGAKDVSKILDDALRYLQIALDEAPQLGEWAKDDPSLDTLRRDPKHGPDFFGLIWAKADPSGLSGVESIGPKVARRLAVLEITSADKLAHDLADRANWARWAKQLDAKNEDFETWSRVATLMSGIHASAEEINLLNDVGVRSVDDLLALPPFALARDLGAANAVMKRTDTSPDEKRVKGWVILARA